MTSPSTDTRRHLGPEDAGALLSNDEFERADWAPGYQYELVAGRLHVTPAPNAPHVFVQDKLLDHLKAYARVHPNILKWVAPVSRVLTDELGGPTNVEPDIAAYREIPPPEKRMTSNWRELSPILVVEVVSESNPKKDLERNPDIYAVVPSIREYWIVDPRKDPMRPTLLALVRGPRGWTERAVGPGGVYRTDLLPGLEVDLAALLLVE